MNDTTNWLVHDHRKYDELLTDCEMAAEMASWKEAMSLFNLFINALKLHMKLEDEVIYPLLEEKKPELQDEMTLLHEEHDNLVRLLHDLHCVIKTKNIDHFLESLLPLHKTLNKHNEHEEDVFQQLEDDSLLTHRDEVLKRLSTIQAQQGHKSRGWDF